MPLASGSSLPSAPLGDRCWHPPATVGAHRRGPGFCNTKSTNVWRVHREPPTKSTNALWRVSESLKILAWCHCLMVLLIWRLESPFTPMCLWDAGCHLFKYRNESQSCKRFWNCKELYPNNGNQKKNTPMMPSLIEFSNTMVGQFHQCSLQWNCFSLTVNWQLGRG